VTLNSDQGFRKVLALIDKLWDVNVFLFRNLTHNKVVIIPMLFANNTRG